MPHGPKLIDPSQFQLPELPLVKRPRGNGGGKYKRAYVDIVTAFDIETTRLPGIEQSFMYVWQWHFSGIGTVIGRTWEEFRELCERLGQTLKGRWMVVYVHNLSYEFQFLRGVWPFHEEDVFAIKSRKVAKCDIFECLELRCSYLHSNMGLDKYTEKMGVEHLKLTGTFDYEKIRYPWTSLTETEILYCVHDVQGLVEAVEKEMRMDGDTLYTIPLTSTGYVRRDVKAAMQGAGIRWLQDILPDFRIYKMAKEAFRGGNTHANRYYVGEVIENVHSADRSSSYPDVQCNCRFPVSRFTYLGEVDFEEAIDLMNKRGKAALMRVVILNPRLRREDWGAPYLARDKCRKVRGAVYDNGRILKASYLETTITDIDLRIILHEYDFDDILFTEFAYASYGKLPKAMVDCTKDYYMKKTELKGLPGADSEYFYMKSKNKLNSVYGMSAQDPVKQSILFRDGEFVEDDEPEVNLLKKSNRKAFQSYLWGVWVTAWARFRLEEAIDLAHGDVNAPEAPQFIYCDTDSVKYTGVIDWGQYNRKRIKDSYKSKSYATDAKGCRHFMGVYEQEHDSAEFKAWGAKKYATRETAGSPLKITVAGVSKKLGALELEENGGMSAFKPGFIFRKAGGLEAVYNDTACLDLEIEGHQLHIGPNVCLRPSTYKLGLAADYERLLNGLKFFEEMG